MVTSKLRVNDACKVTGLSRNTLYRYMRDGRVKFEEIDGVRWVDISNLRPSRDEMDTSGDVSELSHAIHELTKQVARLCNLMEQDRDTVTVKKRNKPSSKLHVSDNERRAKEAQNKVWAVLEQFRTSKEPMPTLIAMATMAGVERGTFAKHKKTWDAKNGL